MFLGRGGQIFCLATAVFPFPRTVFGSDHCCMAMRTASSSSLSPPEADRTVKARKATSTSVTSAANSKKRRQGEGMQPSCRRCEWANSHPELIKYHDDVWGRELHVDQRLFEFLSLDGAQAGLSWLTILKKRHDYQNAFADWDIDVLASWDPEETWERLKDGPHNIVKHQGKVKSCVTNARAAKLLQEQHGSLDAFLWSFAPRNTGGVCVNFESQYRDLPTESNESRAMSKALKKAGFKFVGPTICYAFMQAVGMVVDHDVHCFLHPAATK